MRLVGDVGGTNTRLALSKAGQILPHTTKSYSNVDWDSFYDVLATYLAASTYAHPVEMVIAVAGPVHETRDARIKSKRSSCLYFLCAR